jgi:phage tail sheath protein FI
VTVPGLYREDVRPRPPDPDPPTGVCAFLGVADGGPAYQATALQRPEAFTAVFGGSRGYLGAAVEGFFAGGGQTCHVVRVDPADATWLDRGLAALEPVPEADLLACPDLASAPAAARAGLQRALLDHCAALGTRFAVLDSFPAADGDGTAVVLAQRADLSGRFGALYHPWVRLADGRAVPPCGHVAGTYARLDAATGPSTPPANAELVGVLDLVPPPTAEDLADLTAAGVNPLRALPARGIRVWGASTLAGTDSPEWTSIGVVRLFVAVARWLERIGVGLAFAPNDLALWVQVRRELSEGLRRLWRAGGLAGADPASAFYVKCDAETNPPEVRDAGMVVTEIGLAPVRPAEFVVVRLVQQDGRTTLV